MIPSEKTHGKPLFSCDNLFPQQDIRFRIRKIKFSTDLKLTCLYFEKGVQVKSCHDGNWKPRPELPPKYSFTSTRHAFRPPRLWPELAQKRAYCQHMSRTIHTRASKFNTKLAIYCLHE